MEQSEQAREKARKKKEKKQRQMEAKRRAEEKVTLTVSLAPVTDGKRVRCVPRLGQRPTASAAIPTTCCTDTAQSRRGLVLWFDDSKHLGFIKPVSRSPL